jgi:hypothetical protein
MGFDGADHWRDHRVAAEPQREAVHAGLEGEPVPVDRAREGQHPSLDLRAQCAEAVHPVGKVAHGGTLPCRRIALKGAARLLEPFTREG